MGSVDSNLEDRLGSEEKSRKLSKTRLALEPGYAIRAYNAIDPKEKEDFGKLSTVLFGYVLYLEAARLFGYGVLAYYFLEDF